MKFVHSIAAAILVLLSEEWFALAEESSNLRTTNQDPRDLESPVPFDATDAQGTPDDVPPAWETVCNGYQDNKARGLCIAYCEAKDCDTVDSPPCSKLRDNFMEITGSPMPCDCPCAAGGIAGYAAELASIDGVGECFEVHSNLPNFVGIRADSGLIPASQFNLLSDNGFCGFAFLIGFAIATTAEEAVACYNLLWGIINRHSLPECT